MEVFCSHIKEEVKGLYHTFPEKLMELLIARTVERVQQGQGVTHLSGMFRTMG